MNKPNSTPTLGSASRALAANGYAPVSLLQPLGEWVSAVSPFFAKLPSWRTSEHPAGVLCRAPSPLAVLVIAPIEDTELAARVTKALADRGLLSGPVRRGSDGVDVRPLRAGVIPPGVRRALSGAVTIEQSRKFGQFDEPVSSIVPLDGHWSDGDLLTVPREKLPAIAADDVEALMSALDELPQQLAAERRPPPKPSIDAWLGAA